LNIAVKILDTLWNSIPSAWSSDCL